MLPKAFSEFMKLMSIQVFHSIHCSMWSMRPTPGLKPTCSFLKMVSMASLSVIWMIFFFPFGWFYFGAERSVTPRQLEHRVVSPYLGSLTISLQVWSRHSRFHGMGRITSLWQSGWQTLLLFRLLITFKISGFACGKQSNCLPRAVQVSSVGSCLLRTSLRRSSHLRSSLSSILILLPYLSFTASHSPWSFPERSHFIRYGSHCPPPTPIP